MQKPYDGPNRRRVFRLYLPADSRLVVRIDDKEYEAVEVAEYSLVVNAEEVDNAKGKVTGNIRWSDGHNTDFKGEVGRLRGKRRVIWKIKGIEMQDVITEQRRLIYKQASHSRAA